jgi:hypothetical protein
MFKLRRFLSRIRSMSCCVSLKQIGEMNLDSARGLELWHKARIPLTTEQFLLSLLSRRRGPESSAQLSRTVFPVVPRREMSVV